MKIAEPKTPYHYDDVAEEQSTRYHFNTHVWRKGESVAAYVSELQGLAQFCNYGDLLETMLRDHLVCGINDESIQRRLLAETALTFKKALELAQGMENAAKDVLEMQGPYPSTISRTIGRRGPCSE